MTVSQENIDRMKRDMLHAVQVGDGVIPADSPDGFTVPQPLDANGLPWFFGPNYKPTDEAIESFTGPMTEDDGSQHFDFG